MVVAGKPIVAVTGATGLQGGSVARFLLADGTFRVRVLTRKPDSANALELAAHGAEVVVADYSNFASLVTAFTSVYGVFGLTNYWESMSSAKEVGEGIALVDAAKACGVQHFVWSTVAANPDRDAENWISKASVDEHLRSSGVPRTSLYTTFYFENFILFDFCKLKKLPVSTSAPASPDSSCSTLVSSFPSCTSITTKEEDSALCTEPSPGGIKCELNFAINPFGTENLVPTAVVSYSASWPLLHTDGPIGGFSVHEIGAYALAAFKHPHKWLDKDMYIPPDIFTPRMFVAALNEELVQRAKNFGTGANAASYVELHEVDDAAFMRARELSGIVYGAKEMWAK
ncbi:hypothetical protein M0805_004003 [Coniferiporia weirii]|nr:hypothetical protein M0805_004003 [Coniferiporia weirii]